MNRVEACHFLPNEKSGRVMQRAGMSFEGTARKKAFAKGRFLGREDVRDSERGRIRKKNTCGDAVTIDKQDGS